MKNVPTLIDIIGRTPLVRLVHFGPNLDPPREILAKLEFLNPGGSMKDRMALKMIEAAEREGRLKPGDWIVEPTSGNTGFSLAWIAAIRGYRLVLVVMDKVAPEKIRALEALGAEVVVCPTEVPPEDPRSYYSVARRIAEERGAFYPNQYANPNNPRAYYETLGPEIWEETGGELDALIVGMGTGGTISGTGKFLKEKNPDIRIVGVDPVGSVYGPYLREGKVIQPHQYDVEGIGEDFFPSTMDLSIVDDVVTVTDEESFRYAHLLARKEGIFTGGSGGAVLAGTLKYLAAHPEIRRVVIVLPDRGERYLSKVYNPEWLRERGYAFLDHLEDDDEA